MAIALTTEQNLAVRLQGKNLLVSAAAGSGKTRVLVERILDRVCGKKQRDIDEFLVLTFTNAAADEMKSRILSELSERAAQSPSDAHLRKQLNLIYRSQISTLDAFCARLVRENAPLVDLPGNFRIADDTECDLIRDQILEELIEEKYEEGHDAFLQLADYIAFGRDDRKLESILMKLHDYVQSHASPRQWIRETMDQFLQEDDFSRSMWGKTILSEMREGLLQEKEFLSEAVRLCREEPKLEKAYLPAVASDEAQAEALLHALENGNWNEIKALIDPYRPLSLKAVRNFESPELQNEIKSVHEHWKKFIGDQSSYFAYSNEQISEDRKILGPVMRELFDTLLEFESRFLSEKRRRGIAEFGDLVHSVIDLLKTPEGEPSALCRDLASQYEEILVDEYQDINECQDQILSLLGRDNLFFVGDIKQSIYRFRLADPTIFLEKYKTYQALEQLGEMTVDGLVHMTHNFRSRREVLSAVNTVFGVLMKSEAAEIDYTEKEALYPGKEFDGPDSPTELFLISKKDVYAEEENPEKLQAEATLVAERIRRMLTEKEKIKDGDILRPVRPGDIVILQRSPNITSAVFERELQKRGIPCSGLNQDQHWTGIEWSAPVSILQCIDNPRQDIPLASALRSPLFSFSTDDLAAIRGRSREGCLYDALLLCREDDERVDRFLSFLEEMRLIAPDLSVEDLLFTIYNRLDLYAIVGMLPDGSRRQKDLDTLLEAARFYEKSSYRGLFSFLHYLQDGRENNRLLKNVEASADSESVRIMSIHKSKGLEFPVVFVSGLGRQFNMRSVYDAAVLHPKYGIGFSRTNEEMMVRWNTIQKMVISSRIKKEDLAEEMRLLYVAMTRASEKLILTGEVANLNKIAKKVWSAHLAGSLNPTEILSAQCPLDWIMIAVFQNEEDCYSEHTTLERKDGFEGISHWKYSVISRLEEAEEKTEEEPSRDAPAKEAAEEEIQKIRSFMEYEYSFSDRVEIPTKMTPTSMKGRYLDHETSEGSWVSETVFSAPVLTGPDFFDKGKKLTAAEKGTATHQFLQFLDYARCDGENEIREQLEELVDKKVLTRQQADSIRIRNIADFFQTSLGKRMIRATEIKREFKFSIMVPAARYFPSGGEEKILLQGVIDCAFLEGDQWVLLDFKTDSIRPGMEEERAARYLDQMETYVYALEKITQIPVRESYLCFLHTGADLQVTFREDKGN